MDMLFDPRTDLEIVRVIAARPATVWRCITEPALLERWFCPQPWAVHDSRVDPRPGGIFHTPMRGPQGATNDEGPGCVLIADAPRLFMVTDAMGPGFHPRGSGFMTGVWMLEPVEAGTRLTARALHADPDARDRHEKMGFHDGWGTAAAQLDALARSL
jgi:uncharacterized protein YndB with AHSA1/START domain